MSSASVTIDHLLGETAVFPLEDQALVHEVIGHRLVEARRREIAGWVEEARAVLERGRCAAGDDGLSLYQVYVRRQTRGFRG